MNKRKVLREKAKRAYKALVKKQRPPFNQFFKDYLNGTHDVAEEEDFDLDSLININNLEDDNG